MTELNTEVITEFRANSGVVRDAFNGYFKDIRLLLLHHVGRRSRREYVNPLLYLADGDGFLLVGSNGANPREVPQWVANLAESSGATIEVGERRLTVRPTVLWEGPERDRLYALLVAYWPELLKYQTHTARTFPVIRLDPSGQRP